MKKQITVILGAAIALIVQTHGSEAPKGWHRAGSHPKEYEMTLDRTTTHSGNTSASLKSRKTPAQGFGTLMQTFEASSYRGKRIRMSGHVRAQEVEDWAGLWLRVDGPKNEVLSFDNMQNRAVKGTLDWQKYEIVLDVPEAAEQIAFGLLLTGAGQVWMDDLKFEVVGKEVPITGAALGQHLPKGPQNLDFEE